ncbi:MAG TPA: sigma-70 family RNA polymerase sigma factor [Polyangiaceae bacterium]|nr:sigma-70 family RNA polymerase sigma factor [Polyangiaceae bacterium]
MDPRLSFEQLYRDYFPFTWRTLRGLGIPPIALDDAAQEVWLIVHRRLPEFEGRSTAKTWLFGIALNVSRNLKRRSATRELDRLPLHLPSSEPGPAEEREGREAWELVRSYLDTLDRERREVFVCSLLEGLSATDTARATGLEVATVHHRVRALRRGLSRWAQRQKGSSHDR